MTDKHNPPAFPQTEPNGMVTVGADGTPKAEYSTTSGMSLRDWFAGQYIAGTFGGEPGSHLRPENAAREAYELADAMLAARAKGGDA